MALSEVHPLHASRAVERTLVSRITPLSGVSGVRVAGEAIALIVGRRGTGRARGREIHQRRPAVPDLLVSVVVVISELDAIGPERVGGAGAVGEPHRGHGPGGGIVDVVGGRVEGPEGRTPVRSLRAIGEHLVSIAQAGLGQGGRPDHIRVPRALFLVVAHQGHEQHPDQNDGHHHEHDQEERLAAARRTAPGQPWKAAMASRPGCRTRHAHYTHSLPGSTGLRACPTGGARLSLAEATESKRPSYRPTFPTVMLAETVMRAPVLKGCRIAGLLPSASYGLNSASPSLTS